jgi:hypothetical protein
MWGVGCAGGQREAMTSLDIFNQRPDLLHLSTKITSVLTASLLSTEVAEEGQGGGEAAAV